MYNELTCRKFSTTNNKQISKSIKHLQYALSTTHGCTGIAKVDPLAGDITAASLHHGPRCAIFKLDLQTIQVFLELLLRLSNTQIALLIGYCCRTGYSKRTEKSVNECNTFYIFIMS